MSDEEAVKARHPGAHVHAFGWLTGQVHIITHENGKAVYLSSPFPALEADEEDGGGESDASDELAAWADARACLEPNPVEAEEQ